MPSTPAQSQQSQRIEALERRMDKYDDILATMGKQLVKIETLMEKQEERVERMDTLIEKNQETFAVMSTLLTRHDTKLAARDETLVHWKNAVIGFILTLLGAGVSTLIGHFMHP